MEWNDCSMAPISNSKDVTMACTQGLDRPRLVDAFANYSPWVMPVVIVCTKGP